MSVERGITRKELEELLKEPESASLECKEAKGHYPVSKLGEYCCAIANAGGGHMLLGVTDRLPREVVGTGTYPKRSIPEIEAELAGDLKPGVRIEISEVMLHDKRVVAAKIPSRQPGQPVRHCGTLYTRTGHQKREMTDHELSRILGEVRAKTIPAEHWLEEACTVDMSEEEVFELLDVNGYYTMKEEPKPFDHASIMKDWVDERILVPADSKHRFSITRMGALLLAHSIEKCSSAMSVKRLEINRFEGNSNASKAVFRHQFDRGYAVGFTEMLDMVVEQLIIQAKSLRDKGVEIAPVLAVRELLANAIIHQDFEMNARVVLRVFRDEVNLVNPGASLVASDYMMENSESRNARMLALMRKFKLAEELTSGIQKIIAEVEHNNFAPPIFSFQDRFTHVKLPGHSGYDNMSRREIKIAAYQHCLLQHARQSSMTNASLRSRFNINEGAVQQISELLDELVKDGRIKPLKEKSGSKRHASYVPYWA